LQCKNKTNNNINKLEPAATDKRHKIMNTTANNTKSKKMALDDEMVLWETRSHDEFGTILKEINEAAADYFYAEPDEFGIINTPISHYKVLYAMDGTRKAIAHTIYAMLENRDILEDETIKALADKMMELAA
jgi:hypothetical protein